MLTGPGPAIGRKPALGKRRFVYRLMCRARERHSYRGRARGGRSVLALWQLSVVELVAAYDDARRRYAEKKFARDTQRARLEWLRAKAFAAATGGVSDRRSVVDESEDGAQGAGGARHDPRSRPDQGRSRRHYDGGAPARRACDRREGRPKRRKAPRAKTATRRGDRSCPRALCGSRCRPARALIELRQGDRRHVEQRLGIDLTTFGRGPQRRKRRGVTASTIRGSPVSPANIEPSLGPLLDESHGTAT